MSNYTKSSSEKAFQEKFVKELKKYKWSAPDSLNGNIQKVTVNDLIDHWRGELNRINADQLEGVPLTDNEFQQVMSKVEGIDNSYEAAKILAIEESKGKIDGIYRDSNPKITREQVTLTIFKKAEVRGGDSSYNIAREVVTENGNRFDLVLLINGLPLINIEQKRADKTISEAFGQFKRYYADGEYTKNFMAFSQMMVITSEVVTRYFATPKSLDSFNMSFVFGWADKNNKPVNDWREVVRHFLMIPMMHQMVGDYLVIDEAINEEDRKHMLMRPYQVYALQAVEIAAFGWENENIPHGGFVWHTTGSGKTITSFKTALFLSTRVGFDKVIFLVDRRELDSKTSENFKAYAHYEAVSVDDTKYTYELGKQLRSSKKGIVVTTIFKLNSLVKELSENSDYTLADKKFVFIIDEAHRTTMRGMMASIKKYFEKNSLFYGFTGTPLFEENKAKGMINEKSEYIDTTEKLFGPLLHQYTIDEAIADRNVLGFHVDYVNTGEFGSYEELSDRIAEYISKENTSRDILETERDIAKLSELELEKKAKEIRVLTYQDEVHIPRVVEYILKNWESQSQKRHFNAILTVALKERVIAYYHEFKKQLKDKDYRINIAMTFSFGNENDTENVATEVVEGMFKDYADFTGIEFIPGNRKSGEEAYFEDLVDRSTRGGSGRNPKNIDLIIVADQLLTGYDSKRLNTLYVDRTLELQGLIQAYSRTNRIYGKSKEFGTIINFQFPRITEENVNNALKLYGSGGTSSKAIVEKYEVAVDKLKKSISEMVETLTKPSDWELLKRNENRKKQFNDAFKKAIQSMNVVQQYYEYEWDDDLFGMKEEIWLKYIGSYENLNEKDDIDNDVEDTIVIVNRTRISKSQKITAGHIISLIGEKARSVNGVQAIDDETLRIVYEQIQELSDMGKDRESKILKEFVDSELLTNKISSEMSFDEAFEVWKKKIKNDDSDKYAEIWGVSPDLINKSLEKYSSSPSKVIPYIEEILVDIDMDKAKHKSATTNIDHCANFSEDYPKWLAETSAKYGDD